MRARGRASSAGLVASFALATLACTPKLANGSEIPTISGHAPPLAGQCSAAVASSVCPGLSLRHPRGGGLAQFVVDQGEEPVDGVGVAIGCCGEEEGDVGGRVHRVVVSTL